MKVGEKFYELFCKNLSSVSGREKTQKKQTLEVTHDLNNIDSLRLEDAFLG